MSRRTKILIAAGALLLVAGAILLSIPREPSHGGRPLSAWVKDLEDPTKRDAARAAIQAMGPKAIPYLTQSLEQRNNALLRFYRRNETARRWFRGFKQKLNWHEPVMESANAARALAELGPAADVAIPNLVAALGDSSPLVAQESAKCLGAMRERAVPALAARLKQGPTNDTVWAVRALMLMGRDAKAAAPELARLVTGGNPLADWSVIALAQVGGPAIPFMTNYLTSSNVVIRTRAASFFYQAGTNSIFATNELIAAANDPDPGVRGNIWNALGRAYAPREMTRAIWLRGLNDPVVGNVQVALNNLWADEEAVRAHSNEIAALVTHSNLLVRHAVSNVLNGYNAWPKK